MEFSLQITLINCDLVLEKNYAYLHTVNNLQHNLLMPQSIAPLDALIIVIYFLLMLGIGLWFSRRNNNSSQFTTAMGRIPGWALGLSFYATFLSAITFLGDPGKSFGSNWNPFVFSLSMPFAAYVSARFFVPFYREQQVVSAYTHLEDRFGAWARTYAMLCFIMTQLARMGTIFYGVALMLNALSGLSMQLIILCLGVCIIVYTVLGGMEAVIWTEVIQAIIKTLGALLILGIILVQVDLGTIVEKGLAEQKFSLGTFRPDFVHSSFWVVFLYGFFINLTNFGVDQNYIQRYHTARNTQDASRSIWLCVVYYLPISMLFFFIGTALFVYYQQQPDLILELKQQVALDKGLPLEQLQPADYGDKVLPFFIKTQIPTGFLGLLMAALLSAAMSTMSSGMNSSATVFLQDIYQRYFNPNASAAQQLRVLRIATIVMGCLGMAFGIGMIGVKSLLDAWWKMAGLFASGMLGLFLLGFLNKRVGERAAQIAAITGLLLIAWLTFRDSFPVGWRSVLEPKLTVVVGTLSIVGVGLLLERIWREK